MLGLVHLWFAAYGRVAVVLATALCVGYPATRKLVRGPAAPVLALLIGLALLSLFICLLAWCGLFNWVSVALVAGAAVLLSVRCLLWDVPRWRKGGVRLNPALIVPVAVLVIVLLGFSMLTLYPSTSLAYDATSYHLPIARDLVSHHGLVYDPFVRYSFFPQANESLFAFMLLLSRNPVSSAALEYSVLALVVLAMPCWFVGAGRSALSGFFAGLLILASPVVIWSGTAAFVDTWTLAFIVLGLLVGLDAAEGRARPLPTLFLSGLLLGEAAATKYTGAVFGVWAFVGVLLTAGRSRIRPIWLLLTVAGFVAVAAPWYAWTLHTTGDPLYPFATGLFGNRHGLWTPVELSYQNYVARGDINPGVTSILRRDWQYLLGVVPYSTGAGRSPLSWTLGAGFLALLARSARCDRALIGVAVAGALCVGTSLFISADPRYLVPALGVLAVCGGLGADLVLHEFAPRSVRARFRQTGLVGAGCVVLAIPILWSSAGYARALKHTNGYPPTAPASINAYIAARTPCYPAVTYLNRRAGASYRAWAYNCEDARYYARGRLIGDVFSTGSTFRIFDNGGLKMPNDQALWERLEPLAVQWIILPATMVPRPNVLGTHRLFSFAATTGTMNVFRVAPKAG